MLKRPPCFTFSALLIFTSLAAPLQTPAQTTACVPENAALVLELLNPQALTTPLLKLDVEDFLQRFAVPDNGKMQELRGMISFLEGQLGTDWRTGVRQLIGQGATLAVLPDGGSALCVSAADEKLLASLHDLIRQFASAEAEKQGQGEQVASSDYKGKKLWTFGPGETHAILTNQLWLANRRGVLENILDRQSGPQTKGVASTAQYQDAQRAVGKDAAARLYLDLRALRQIPGVQKALENDNNPLSMLLLADTKEALQRANWLAIGLYVDNAKLTLRTFTDGKAAGSSKSAAFAQAKGPDEGVLPNLSVPRQIAGVSLCRDLRAFYSAKDELFPERTSGLVFFENMMGIFFSGIELTEGVLGELKSDIRLVVAAQNYDAGALTPSVQIPAFAAVFRLRNAQKFGETIEEAWQKALGLVNFTRGQKALPGLVIDRDSHSNSKYTLAYYRPGDETNRNQAELRYNFRPTLARPGDYVVLSSTDALAKDLIDALKKEAASLPKPSHSAHAAAEIKGTELRQIFHVNREHMITQNMLEKGHSRSQAENDIGTFLSLLDCLDQAMLSMSRDDGHPGATLELRLKMPSKKTEGDRAQNEVQPAGS